MGKSYQNVLERLKEERLDKGLSQLEMGRIMRMSQSHYSKAEKGIRRFTYYEIQFLCESEIDSYYIFTGKKCEVDYKFFLMDCSYDELLYFFNIICLTIEYFYMNSSFKQWENTYNEVKHIKNIIVLGRKNNNIFYNF